MTQLQSKLEAARKARSELQQVAADLSETKTRSGIAYMMLGIYALILLLVYSVLIMGAFNGETAWKTVYDCAFDVFKTAVLPLTTLVVGYYMAKK